MDVEMSSVLTESVSSFLTNLDFTVFRGCKRIIPPKAKTCIAECIFCVLYCLSSWKLCFKSWSETSMKVVLQILTLNFIMWTLLWNWCMCSEQTNKYHLNSSFGFAMKLRYVLWHKPSNFTWTSNFTAVFALMFSATCQKAKFKRKIISIHTNSFIIITCPNPVLLVLGFRQVG